MKDLIEVFKMDEISKEVRANLIVKLGVAINAQYGMNLTEPAVFELGKLLQPDHPILKYENFLWSAGIKNPKEPSDER